MPAKSKSQQRLMGLAYAYKSGEIKAKDLNPKYADKVKELAKSMTQKQLKDFAKTKHKKLPEKVEETLLKFGEFNKILENNSNLNYKINEEKEQEIIKWLRESLNINIEYADTECCGKQLDVKVIINTMRGKVEEITSTHVDLY